MSRFLTLRMGALCALVLFSCGATAPADDGPVAAWDVAHLDGDTLVDATGNGHDLAVVGATAEEFMGRAFLRTGTRRYAIGPPLGDGWPAFSLLAVVFQEQPAQGFAGIACRDAYGGPEGDVFGILTDPRGNWVGRVMTAAGQTAISTPAQTGWRHLALTYDGAEARLYVDGEQAAEQALTGDLVAEPDTPFAIGCYSNLNGWYSGGVAAVQLYDRALTSGQVADAWAAWQRENPAATAFTFAQASDVHITDTRSVEILNDAVDMINADPRVAFSLWLGDLTQDSTSDAMALARMGLDRLRRPYYAVRGNHDMRAGYYEREFGELNYTFEYAGWKFIMLDSNPGGAPIGQERIEWLQEVLAETDPAQPLVLCTHHPLYPNTRAYLLPGAADVIALFADHNLKAALAGHYHANQEEVVDGVLYTTTVCLATTRSNHDGTTERGYRLFHCTEDSITTEFVLVR